MRSARTRFQALLLCLGLSPALCGAVDLDLGVVSSPLEGTLVRDQVRLYLDSLERPAEGAQAPRYRCALEVRHRKGRLFDYVLDLSAGDRTLGRQSGTYSFEEFRSGFGRALEAMLCSPPDVRVVSLERFQAPAGEAELRRRFIERLEATEQILVLESADFAHHRLGVRLRGPQKRLVAEMELDGKALDPVADEAGDLWRPALAAAAGVSGVALERVRLVPAERSEPAGAPRALTRGPLEYRIGSEQRVRRALFDGEGYPVLVEKGVQLTILRPGSYPRTLRLRDEAAGLKQVLLSTRTASVTFRILAPGHRAGPLKLTGYDGEELSLEDGATAKLKRDAKYRYSMDVLQRGVWQVVGGWFVLPEDATGPLELYDERFPDNLELSVQEEPASGSPDKAAEEAGAGADG